MLSWDTKHGIPYLRELPQLESFAHETGKAKAKVRLRCVSESFTLNDRH